MPEVTNTETPTQLKLKQQQMHAVAPSYNSVPSQVCVLGRHPAAPSLLRPPCCLFVAFTVYSFHDHIAPNFFDHVSTSVLVGR